jgi:hypothetical protein
LVIGYGLNDSQAAPLSGESKVPIKEKISRFCAAVRPTTTGLTSPSPTQNRRVVSNPIMTIFLSVPRSNAGLL